MTSFTVMIDIATIALPLFIASCIIIAIVLIGYILADVPSTQVNYTFGKLGSEQGMERKGFVDKVIGFIHNEERSAERSKKEEELRYKVDIWSLRLKKTMSYDDIKRQGNSYMVLGVIVFTVFLFVGLFTGMIMLSIVGIGALVYCLMYTHLQIEILRGQIQKLNKSLLFELPNLTAVFAELLPTGRSVENIFEDYLDQAGAFKRDIELTLADFKNKSKYAALAEMSSRIQTGERLDEIGQFIDMLKSTANMNATTQNLHGLSDRVYQTYVQPYIEGKRGSKITTISVCIIIAVSLVMFLYVSPMFIQLAQSMQELN